MELHFLLLNGDIRKIEKLLNSDTNLLISYDSDIKNLPAVISAIHHSFSHENAPEVLKLLKKHNADFNKTRFVDTHFKLKVQCDLNPIAWLLLNGGDRRLLPLLVEYGCDPKHYSVDKVKALISNNKTQGFFSYDVPYKSNQFDESPVNFISQL